MSFPSQKAFYPENDDHDRYDKRSQTEEYYQEAGQMRPNHAAKISHRFGRLRGPEEKDWINQGVGKKNQEQIKAAHQGNDSGNLFFDAFYSFSHMPAIITTARTKR